MARRRTVELLPEIFRTGVNRQFLSATLDQLIQEPNVERTYGFVGRRVGPGVNPADNYVQEPTAQRTDYQLEPGIVTLKPDTNHVLDAMTYPGMLSALDLQGGPTQRQDLLWQSEYYSFDPFCDLDKFANYSEYYWLPQGPDAVDVSNAIYPLTDDFEVANTTDGFDVSGLLGTNPDIYLVRGGNYRFIVDQPGSPFWIQAAPGAAGVMPYAANISSRTVLGVNNNGVSQGTVTFDVPLKTAQDEFYEMPLVGTVDLVTTLKFDQINNVYVDAFLAANPQGIDGITNLDGRTIIFLDQSISAEQGGWIDNSQYDPLTPTPPDFAGQPGSYDTLPFDLATPIEPFARRYSVWRASYQGTGRQFIRLTSVLDIDPLTKLAVGFGDVFSNREFYKDSLGYFQQVPLLTAVQDVLYYQAGDQDSQFGIIRLVDPAQNDPLDVDQIVGARQYISPNGVRFTNGLKVVFRGPTLPESFRDREFYVEGVGSGPGIDARVGFVDGEAYYGTFHIVAGQRVTGSAGSGVYQQWIWDTVAESLENLGRGPTDIAPLPTTATPGAVNGNGIRLIPVSSMITPERYLLEQSTDQDPQDPIPLLPDYITMNRSAGSLNAWSRSNRWFHRQVIEQTARLNNDVAVFDNRQRAKRPIIEFRANLRLWQSGTQGLEPIDVIDFEETDALSNVAGTAGYTIDDYALQPGSRVIFAADQDPQVRNRVYRVDFIDPDGDPTSLPVINLVPVTPGAVLIDQMVVCRSGDTLVGRSFWFDGVDWREVQPKIGINQPPLFDVYDINGRSFGDLEQYPSSTFRGSRLFGYALGGTQAVDTVLGFALRYLNINNIGDIVFENYFYTDTFVYVKDRQGITESVSTGVARQYIDRVAFSDLIGWVPAIAENRSRQVFRFTYAGQDLVLDVPVDTSTVLPALQVFVAGQFVDPDLYRFQVLANTTRVTLLAPPAQDTVIEVQALSDVTSAVAFYQVPLNLENNALNKNSDRFTLGIIRNHYEGACQNLQSIVGPIIGSNNSRDLGNILPYGDNIVQQSSPLVLAGTFLRRPQYDVFAAIKFNSQEYEKFKARMMDLVARGDFINSDAVTVLDQVILELGVGRNELSPFYWSDMLPASETFEQRSITVTPITISTFDLNRVYDFTSSNFQSVLVYLNGTILTRGYDYVVNTDSATFTMLTPLAVGDVVTIREYSITYGNYVPNTPTKMGLYPAWRPQKFLDDTRVQPTMVIQGHDGSITRAYGDIRDSVLLEFETRIFNNLKITSPIPLTADEVMPGQFRSTGYSQSQITSILGQDFLSWVGWNRLDYVTQDYRANNEFTWNYSQSGLKLNNQPLLGAWRGIYQYLYDTIYPNTRPWEMLGFSQEPTWWQDQYGPPPYTSGNLVLWEDLANGVVADPSNPRVLPLRRRPGLLSVIPAGSEGELLSPLQAVVGPYNPNSFRRSWTVGDDGPVESAWRQSSSYPFAVMRLLALTRPAKFFSLFADRDRYRFDTELLQYLWQGRYRLDAQALAPLYGDDVSRASFINWIIDYNRQRGRDSSRELATALANTDVRLCYRMAGFSDKKLLKLFVERSTPGGSNAGFLLPDESYQLLLYRNQPFARLTYSSVIVQTTDQGWSVEGYDVLSPFFPIFASQARGATREISAGGDTVRVPTQTTNNLVRVPYGFVFTSRAAVCDFLLSYGRYLESQGLTFTETENGFIMDWNQMCQEFLYWSNQGWTPGSLINLNPVSKIITASRAGAVPESLEPTALQNLLLNQNRQPIDIQTLIIDRLDNSIRLESPTADTLNFVTMTWTAYEHLLVTDNTSLFGDLLYDPVTSARQSRILMSGWVSGDWNGQVDAPGFVLNQDNIAEWTPNRTYSKGEIVLFKDEYWSAATIIQPAEEFRYNDWIRSDFDEIQLGLLNNAATVSDELAQAYNTQLTNLEQEIDLFSFGLIGFRPRRYMSALNLDDVSQVNLYKQFLGTKGTRPSLEIFSLADLGKEIAEYNVYEYWSMLRGTYGANANRSYYELLLDQSLLSGDPSIIQVIEPDSASVADQTVPVTQIWKSSYPITSPNILPVLQDADPDSAFATAGYVNLNDVDFTTFSLDAEDIALSNINVDNIGVGSTIWVARTNPYDWNVYRCDFIPADIIAVSDNLDGRSLVTFNGLHGLLAGDHFIIRFFAPEINGIYRVESVPDLVSVLIDFEFTGFQTTVTGEGVGFSLSSLRVGQASDVAGLTISRELLPGAKVWVDNNGDGRWTVLEKTQPYRDAPDLVLDPPQPDSDYATVISQGLQNLTALVGAPRYGQDLSTLDDPTGTVYAFVKDINDDYIFGAQIDLNTAQVAAFGSAIDVGSQNWAVIGAELSGNGQGYAAVIFNPPSSAIYEQRQILIADDLDWANAQFGASVTMSQDEQWIYVGAPGVNKVYAYGRVDIQPQQITYEADGSTAEFNWSDSIIIDPARPQQLEVRYNTRILFAGNNVPGYSVTASDVVLNFTPDPGDTISLNRRTEVQLDRQLYYNVEPSQVISIDSVENLSARFTVDVTRGVRFPSVTDPGTDYNYGDIIIIDGTEIGGGGNLSFEVTQVGGIYATLVDVTAGTNTVTISRDASATLAIGQDLIRISGSGAFALGTVVANVDVTTGVITVNPAITASGDLQFMASPNPITGISNINGIYDGIGNIQTFDVVNQLSTATDISAITIQLDGVLQRPYIDYTYSAGNVTFTVNPPQGAVILAQSLDHFQYVDTLTVPGLASNAAFGSSVSTTTDGRQVMIGAPYADVGNVTQAGTVYVFDRSVEKIIVTNDSTDTYFLETSVTAPITVLLDGAALLDADVNVGGQYEVTDDSTDSVTFLPGVLAVGDTIEIETNQFTVLQQISAQIPDAAAEFGWVVDQCVNDCSLYVSAPNDSTITRRGGIVEFLQNQARIYGIITSLTDDPVLTAGDHLRINNIYVELSDPVIWSSTNAYATGIFVQSASVIYQSVRAVPTGTDITDTAFWQVSSWLAVLAQDIMAQAPNVRAAVQDQRIVISVLNADSVSPTNRLSVLPGTGTLFADVGFDIYYPQQIITSPVDQQQSGFGSSMFISDDRATLIVGAPTASMILPTTFDSNTTYFDARSTVFTETVLQSGVVYEYDFLPSAQPSITNPGQFAFGQQIIKQDLRPFDRFGAAVDLTTGVLLIGAPGNDLGDSQLDYGVVVQRINRDLSPAWRRLRTQTPAVDIQLLNTVFMYDRFAASNKQYFDFFDPLQGRLLGAVRQNIDFISAQDPASYNVGDVNNQGSRWGQERVGQIWWDTNRARYLDPNQGDLVYASQRWGQLFPGSTAEIYQWISSTVPPAEYNGPGVPRSNTSYVVSSGVDAQGLFVVTYFFWITDINTVDRVARKTLSVNTLARYIENPRGSGISYIAPLNPSTTAIYNGAAYISALDTVLHIEFDKQLTSDAVHVEYQLIAQGRADSFLDPGLYRKFVDSLAGIDSAGNPVPDPRLPPSEQYGVAFRPRQSFFVNRLTALQNYLGAVNRLLLTYPAAENRTYSLLEQAEPEPTAASGQWNLRVADYQELTYQDIYAVPLGYRYLVMSDSTNNGLWTIYQVLARGAVRFLQLARVQTYDTRLYWSRVDWYEPGYDPLSRIVRTVPNVAALQTIDVPVGSSVKVLANAQGLFEIYVRQQLDVTTQTTEINAVTLEVSVQETGQWRRVGLQNGTIQFSNSLQDYELGRFGFDVEVFDAQYFDQEPVIETRYVVQAINQEILTGDLAIERNRLLMLMFDYILTEQQAPDWLTKTSLIDVDHVIRNLEPFQIYREDNQDFVLDYIQEVKPYHVQIREFNLRYRGIDQYLGDATDFDLPAYWDAAQQLFISPVLDDTGTQSTTSSVPATAQVWRTFPWNQWFNNYLLEIESAVVVAGGSGYTVPPVITVTGDAIRAAQMRATINSQGQVSGITVLDPGFGYRTQATIEFTGGNGSGAQAVARMGNGLVRNIATVMKFDRFRYRSDIVDWQANQDYDNGTLVRYADRVWEASSADSTVVSGAAFDFDDWTLIPAGDLDGLDRTRGYYTPTAVMPGIDLPQLITGLEYPGVQVMATPFPEAVTYLGTGTQVAFAFPAAQLPFSEISAPDQQIQVTVNGELQLQGTDYTVSFSPRTVTFVSAPVVNAPIVITVGYPLAALGDVIYSSQFTDAFLGTRPSDIDVSGGEFVDTYESHAPEELMPGIGFDTLDFRVFTTPGSDWQGPGHGWPQETLTWEFDAAEPVFDFGLDLPLSVQLSVWNQSQGTQLSQGSQYTVDWVQRRVTVTAGATTGDVLRIIQYELGGGNQLYRDRRNGATVGNSLVVPINRDIIYGVTVFANGVPVAINLIEQLGSTATEITFFQTFGPTDNIVVTVFGSNSNLLDYSWSAPQIQYFVYSGTPSFVLSNSMEYSNPANILINVNGLRVTPAGGATYLANGSETVFFLPRTAGYLESDIIQSEVSVYIDSEPQPSGTAWNLDPDDISTQRTITFTAPPPQGSRILISVNTGSPYSVSGNVVTWDLSRFVLVTGDVVAVTTWNDTRQQDLVTEVWQGPTTQGITVGQGYDDTLYDEGDITGDPGSFSYSTGSEIFINRFDLGQPILNPSRLIVSVAGQYLFPEQGYAVEGSEVVISGTPLSPTAIIAITYYDQTVIPGELAFRIFQDMRGRQDTYRITASTTTRVITALPAQADIIYLQDVSRLPTPDLANGLFGLITINGERIAYREKDTVNNTVSGLRRGTAGTGAAAHAAGSEVYDISVGNLMPAAYQDQQRISAVTANGATTVFVAQNLSVQGLDSTELLEAVRVQVGGITVLPGPSTYEVTASAPVTVEFVAPPASGVEVEISILQGLSWYQPGISTPSDGVALQETNTVAARFLRGD